MKKQTEKPNNSYGKVYLPILTCTDLNVTERVVYSLLSVKQGSSDVAHLTQTQIADSLSLTTRTIGRAFDKLKAAGIIESATTGWKVNQPDIKNQYGKVEQIVLGSTFLSNHAKLLYSYYTVVTAGVATCTRGAELIISDLGIRKGSYQKAFKELVDSELITTGKRRTVHGYVNVVAPRRLAKANPRDFLPASWFKEDDVVLDTSDVNFYEVAAKINAKANRTKSTEDADISAPSSRTKEHHLEGQKGTTNTNHDINHNITLNSKPELAASTAVQVHEGRINQNIYSILFNYKLMEDVEEESIKLINTIYTTIRSCAGKYEWRMSESDFKLISGCLSDYQVLGTIELIDEYGYFLRHELIPNRKKAESFAYYLSEGIMQVYIAYFNTMNQSKTGTATFDLDDRTTRKNYAGTI